MSTRPGFDVGTNRCLDRPVGILFHSRLVCEKKEDREKERREKAAKLSQKDDVGKKTKIKGNNRRDGMIQ